MKPRFKSGDLVKVIVYGGTYGYFDFPIDANNPDVTLKKEEILLYVGEPVYVPSGHPPCARFLYREHVVYVNQHNVMRYDPST